MAGWILEHDLPEADIVNAWTAFLENDEIPPVEKFVERLQSKVDSDMKLGLRLDVKTSSGYFDAPRPTSTGRIKEEQAEYAIEDE